MGHLIVMGREDSTNESVALSVAMLLTWIAGVVDAIGFLSFARVYTANMSGNSVAIGIALGQQNWRMAFFRFWPVFTFVFGLLLGRIMLEIGARLRVSRIATAVFLVESILLAMAAYLGHSGHASQRDGETYLDIALLALAMGTQNAALTRFSSLTLHTGFVTGTLLKATSESVKVLTWIWGRVAAGVPLIKTLAETGQQDPFRLGLLLWLTWLAYVLGAVVGTVGVNQVKANAVVFAVVGLAVLMVVDLRDPLAIQDESQQDQGA